MARQSLSEADRKIIDRAITRFRTCEEAMVEIRREAADDDKFVAGDQWPNKLKVDREREGRPCHIINKLKVFVNRIVNENRQNRPAIKTRPVDDVDDVDTSEVKNGLLKHIAYGSDAESAYDLAVSDAVRHGFGFFRVCTDYCDDNSFDQDIRIDRIPNSFSVLFPVQLCIKPDWSDAPYVFVMKDYTKEEFEAQYPDSDPTNWVSADVALAQWLTETHIRVVEYWELEEKDVTLYLLQDGSTTTDKPEDPLQIVKTRASKVKKWNWYLLTSSSILDRKEWPIKYHPIIPVLGEEMVVDGRLLLISLTRFARDPQRMYNYWRSCETEMIALAPKAPFIGAKGQFEGYESQWKQANRANFAYLQYNPVVDAATGTVLPAPQRTAPPAIPAGYVNAALEASEDIKSTTGIFDASLGSKGNETSGRAILSRQKQSDVANFHFADNLSKALRQAGRVILELIPIIYDTPRTVKIIGEDKKDKIVKVNQQYTEGNQPKFHDMSSGKYDVTVDTGPGYQSKREEEVNSILELIRVYPQMAAVSADLLVENLDFPGAQDIAQRLRKAMPPQLLEDEKDKDKNAPPNQQQIVQILGDVKKLQLQNQMLLDALKKTTDDLANQDKDRELKMDLALLQSETQLQLANVKNKAMEATLDTKITADLLKQKYSSSNGGRQSNTPQALPAQEEPTPQPEQPMPAPLEAGAPEEVPNGG